jgi:alkane 1-monooxygenase
MKTRVLKYIAPITFYIFAWIGFLNTGWLAWIALLYAWVTIPLLELLITPDVKNMNEAEEVLAKNDVVYDYMLYSIVPLQYCTLFYFLYTIQQGGLSIGDVAARIVTMGLLCGIFGINVAHELGHRNNKTEQFLAKSLLLTSLYMHFFIEHNKGHHKNVATPNDPSSARKNEPVYLFYFRTFIYTYLGAWHIANDEQRKNNLPALHWKNEMLQAQIVQWLFVLLIFFIFNWYVTICFLAAAFIGALLLETVNYIEHYGLQRKPTSNGNFERAMPHHSWNSNHPLGRLMLFELSRHSDHHYLASRKYQILRHHDNAPQLPTGYPGSMILSLIPPLWFYVMNKKIAKIEQSIG